MAKKFLYMFLDDLTLLKRLLGDQEKEEELWKEFLRRFTKLILKIIWQFEKDKDRVMDKYLWVCTKLAANNFFILKKFNEESKNKAPKFTTWLVAVVRNLCVDEHRSTFGRKRLPKAILNLGEQHRKIFQLYFLKGYSIEEIEIELTLENSFVNEALEKIEDSLKRSRDLIYLDHKETEKILLNEMNTELVNNPEDELNELEMLSGKWLSKLPEEEKAIVRLKFWEDLSAKDIANILGYENEQKVYAILRNALKTLRKHAERDIKA